MVRGACVCVVWEPLRMCDECVSVCVYGRGMQDVDVFVKRQGVIIISHTAGMQVGQITT